MDACGGLKDGTYKLIAGGPMMGMAISREDIPVTKGCSGIVALDKLGALADESPCIRCARCMNACPMHLAPAAIDRAVRKDLFEAAEKLNALNCIECGACASTCPVGAPAQA